MRATNGGKVVVGKVQHQNSNAAASLSLFHPHAQTKENVQGCASFAWSANGGEQLGEGGTVPPPLSSPPFSTRLASQESEAKERTVGSQRHREQANFPLITSIITNLSA